MFLATLLLPGFARDAIAQSLTFIPGPSGIGSDPTIPEIPHANVFVTYSADLQGNGRRDLILGIGSAPPVKQVNPLRILRPREDGTALVDVTRHLLGHGALPSMQHPREIDIADFNRDGRPDIFFAAHGYDAPPFPGEQNVILLSKLDGTYVDGSSLLPSALDFSHHVALGDIDGDGIVDIFVGNAPLPVNPYFLMGRADGTYRQAFDLIPLDVRSPSGSTFLASLLVDLDKDGAPDLVLASFGDGEGRNLVLFNDGTGNFTTRQRVALPVGVFGPTASMNDVLAMDVNGDEEVDLLLLSTQSGAKQDQGAAVQVLINRGNGVFADETASTFGASASRTFGGWWTFLRAADLDGDGRQDVYATGHARFEDGQQRTISVPMIWLNKGDGTFTAINNDLFPDVGPPLEVMDVDGDGQLDFVTAIIPAPSVQLRYQSFLNRTPRTVPSEPLIGAAVAGNAQASITFAKPLSGDTLPIIGYTASCRQGTLPGASSAFGTASPITVTGLTNGKRYDCSVVANGANGASGPSATVRVAPTANYQGLWWNPNESGWGINFAHQGDVIFATWFTYRADGKPWWLIAVLNKSAEGSYSGSVSTVSGPPFGAVPFAPPPEETAVGTMTVTFSDVSHATLAYTVNGTSQFKQLTPQVFGPLPTCTWGAQPDLALATNYQDLWWNPQESGWGVNFTHQGDIIFATWFTYDAQGKPWWLIALLEKTVGNVYTGPVSTVTGPPFNAVPWSASPVAETAVGIATATFADGNTASFAYTVSGVAQTKAITRLVFVPAGTVCK